LPAEEHLKQMATESDKFVVIVEGYEIQLWKAVLHGRKCNVLIMGAQAAEEIPEK